MPADSESQLVEALAIGLAILDGNDAFSASNDTADRQEQREYFRLHARERLAARPPTRDAYDQACAALHHHRDRANRAEATLAAQRRPATAYLVITDTGVSLASLDPVRAHEFAFNVTGAIIALPVAADYRTPQEN